jgi:tetratricopeptide (TPR) repeat protein
MNAYRLILSMTCACIFTLVSAQNQRLTNKTYRPEKVLNKNAAAVKADLSGWLNGKLLNQKFKTEITDKKTGITDTPKDIEVTDDSIVFTINNQITVLRFFDITDDVIIVREQNKFSPDGMSYRHYVSSIALSRFIFTVRDKYNCTNFGDDLFFFQQKFREQKFNSSLDLFRPLAEQYKALKVKPPVSEAQRRFIVQANAFSEEKNYSEAISKYLKAIEVDPTAYPAAYSNLALLYAQMKYYLDAIYTMKKYLLLVPDAEDARSAQDKIYEWEIKI